MNAIKTVWSVTWVRHLGGWLLAFAVLYLTVLAYDNAALALEITLIVVLPGPVPVYLNFFVLHRYFENRKYGRYFVSMAAIVVGSGLLIEYVFYWIMQDPDSHISGIGLAFFYIAVTTGLNYYSQGLKQQIRLQEAEVERARAELSALRAQIDPHFLFNTLNSLYALSLDRSEEVPRVVLKLSALMRYVLDGSMREDVAIADELRFISDYVELERLRLEDDPDIRVHIKGDLKSGRIAPLVLVPFVENGFKHGFNTDAGKGYLQIEAVLENGTFVFVVENGKTGTRTDSPGMGLKNVTRRLELSYPGDHELVVQDLENRFRIELRITL